MPPGLSIRSCLEKFVPEGTATLYLKPNLVLEILLSPLEHLQLSVSAFPQLGGIAPSDPELPRLLLSHPGPLSCQKGCVAVTAVPATFLLHLLHTRGRDPESHCDNILF